MTGYHSAETISTCFSFELGFLFCRCHQRVVVRTMQKTVNQMGISAKAKTNTSQPELKGGFVCG
jgi:hypothetical protein